MSEFSRRFLAVVAAVACGLVVTSVAFAEAGRTENSVTGFFKKLFKAPVVVAKDTANDVGTTAGNVGEKVLSETGEKASEGKVGEALIQPVVGTAETVGQTVVDTAKIPVNAIEQKEEEAKQ